MREDMSNGKGWVQRGPRHANTFDKGYSRAVSTNIRDEVRMASSYFEPRPLGHNRPATDEPYLNALREFFGEAIDRLEPLPRQDLSKDKEHLHDIMHDIRPVREQARERGLSHTAMYDGRTRAVAHLCAQFGGKGKLADALRWFLATRGPQVVSRLPGWVHG